MLQNKLIKNCKDGFDLWVLTKKNCTPLVPEWTSLQTLLNVFSGIESLWHGLCWTGLLEWTVYGYVGMLMHSYGGVDPQYFNSIWRGGGPLSPGRLTMVAGSHKDEIEQIRKTELTYVTEMPSSHWPTEGTTASRDVQKNLPSPSLIECTLSFRRELVAPHW